jgi:hypothetical protein
MPTLAGRSHSVFISRISDILTRLNTYSPSYRIPSKSELRRLQYRFIYFVYCTHTKWKRINDGFGQIDERVRLKKRSDFSVDDTHGSRIPFGRPLISFPAAFFSDGSPDCVALGRALEDKPLHLAPVLSF